MTHTAVAAALTWRY